MACTFAIGKGNKGMGMELASQQMVTGGWILILLYIATILYFVVRGAGKTKDIKDYALGNVLFSPAAVGLSLAASITSAATFIINPGFVALYGFSGVISMAFALPARRASFARSFLPKDFGNTAPLPRRSAWPSG